MLAVVMSALAITATGASEASTPTATGVMHQYASVALSPDGRKIASVETVRQPYATSEQHGAVVIRSNDGTILGRLDTCPKCKYSGLDWSADGTRLAFVASADGVATLYGATRRLPGAVPDAEHPYVAYRIAALQGLLASPRWSPQGNSIAVLATAGAHKETGATQAGARELLQLFVTLALGEHEQPVTLRKLLQRRLDVGQQRAFALEQMRADLFDRLAQAFMTGRREFRRRLMQRPDVRAATVAMRFDQHDFGTSHCGVNLDP